MRRYFSTAHACCLNFWTLPEPVSGNSLTISTYFGILKFAIRSFAKSRIACGVSVAPAFGMTNAMTTSPSTGSGTPTIDTSRMSGCRRKKFSISAGYVLNPPTMIMSLRRPVIRRYPSASLTPMSPVWSQPSRTFSAVASGCL